MEVETETTKVQIPQPNPKKARSEGTRVAMAIKATKADFYVSDVDLDDQSIDVIMAAESIRKTLGKLQSGFMVISAGVTHLIVVVDVPTEKTDKLSAKTWLLEGLKGITTEVTDDSTDTLAKAIVAIDTPFKLKDAVRSTAFAYLRKYGLLEEESEEEDIYEF